MFMKIAGIGFYPFFVMNMQQRECHEKERCFIHYRFFGENK